MGCAVHNFVTQWHQMIEIARWRDSKSTMLERLSVWHSKYSSWEAPTRWMGHWNYWIEHWNHWIRHWKDNDVASKPSKNAWLERIDRVQSSAVFKNALYRQPHSKCSKAGIRAGKYITIIIASSWRWCTSVREVYTVHKSTASWTVSSRKPWRQFEE